MNATPEARHIIEYIPGGAQCSCGRTFHSRVNIPSHDYQRGVNLARGNSHRHADAANRRIAAQS